MSKPPTEEERLKYMREEQRKRYNLLQGKRIGEEMGTLASHGSANPLAPTPPTPPKKTGWSGGRRHAKRHTKRHHPKRRHTKRRGTRRQ